MVMFFNSSKNSEDIADAITSVVVPESAKEEYAAADAKGSQDEVDNSVQELNPGELTFDEDTAGGMGRHLGVFSCTLLIVGRIIGTGIFSTPSSILGSVGSVGASLMLWVLGFVLSFCGLFIWLEYGTIFPRSGGEKVYLEAVYQKPKYLATVVFAMVAILLGFTASGPRLPLEKITDFLSIHYVSVYWLPLDMKQAVGRNAVSHLEALSVFKIVILLFVVITGWVVLSGRTHIEDPHANFRDAFEGSSHSSNDYATATFKVLNAYAGWSNVNYVLNDVKNPVRTLKIAGPLGLGVVSVLYMLANVAYFAAATKAEILKSGVTVAALFFKNVFGVKAEKALSVFVALRIPFPHAGMSSLSYVPSTPMAVHSLDQHLQTFAASRVNQELAKEGVPLPFGNRFWASNWPTGKSPLPGLIIHLIPSVIVIIAPPPSVAYPFILDIEGYPQQVINFFIVISVPGSVLSQMDKTGYPPTLQSLVAVGGVFPRCISLPKVQYLVTIVVFAPLHLQNVCAFVDQIELSSPPFDSVSSVRFSPSNPNHLLVSSWDTTVRFYDIAANEQKSKFDHRAAALAVTFSDASHAFSGGLDTSVRELELETEKIHNIGQHADSISSMNYSRDLNTLITGSWDRTVRFWDPRAPTPQTSSHEQPERVYFMDLVNYHLVVAMASRLFHIYDIRKMNKPDQERESSLKYMTRALACMSNGQEAQLDGLVWSCYRCWMTRTGYATASVEGRIAVEYFDPSPEVQDKKYAFKCHRQTIEDVDHVWPVNSLAFHPIYNTFASAGSDGTVSIWDHKVKKRLRQYPRYHSAIPSIAFNCDGTKLAVGVSYTWDSGEEGAKTADRPSVYVRTVGEEVKVRFFLVSRSLVLFQYAD
ncbi:hypothetical protein EW146_g7170 [Bondarzewia mesenterica]|uniref:Anaphase-promoting complex subunit 4 WD40 domain-containing protein n=1 Tax=Bondarzewia mesenterica TaxID=1095465 RepID=A0A4S4LNE9_9AGAM|nr:hypothetical protein EW146_g7170 [Bondarzewia mesenterica]